MANTNFSGVAATTFTGNLVGNVEGAVRQTVEAKAANGAVDIASKIVLITKSTAAALTLAAPTPTTDDGTIITFVATTAAAHTITATTIGFNAGDAAKDVATLGGAIGDGLTVVAYQGEWYVIGNINATLA